jgi:RNA polymerase sigma-70 factor (ECF subfamily)
MVPIAPESLPTLLRAAGPGRDAAAQQLRELLVRAALAYLARQQYPVEAFGADTYLSIAEDYAQEAFAIILRRLATYRGESRFTTWAYSIVINLIADEMRRRCWRRRPLPEEGADESGRLASTAHQDVEALAERRSLWRLIEGIIEQELTSRQRAALVGRIFEEKPLIVLAEELGTSKDAVYKLLHDARKHLKRGLQAHGITTAEALGAFQERRA